MPYADPEIARKKAREYYLRNRESIAAKAKARHAANPEKQRAASRAREAAWKARDPEGFRAARRRYQRTKTGALGATGEARAGVCPVCLKDGPLVLDHDHGTGAVRGWLCRRCNAGLGLMGDTAAAAQRLVSYLVTHV